MTIVEEINFVEQKIEGNYNYLVEMMRAIQNDEAITNEDLLAGFKDVANGMINVQRDYSDLTSKDEIIFDQIDKRQEALKNGFEMVAIDVTGDPIFDRITSDYDKLIGIAKFINEGNTLGGQDLIQELMQIAGSYLDIQEEYVNMFFKGGDRDVSIGQINNRRGMLDSEFPSEGYNR